MPKALYSPDEKAVIVAMICQSISDGMTVRKACLLHDIAFSTFVLWCNSDPSLYDQYTRALSMLQQHWEQDIIDIGDETQIGVIRRDTPQGMTIETRDMIEHRKLRIHTRQWMLSKLLPKRFGDKTQIGGADDLPPIRTDANVTLTPEEAYKRMLGGDK